ncbi:hypothetical protein PHMEG_00015244 [Phytophthora megakarya]|uniref:Uncharacterized protein n=1 Tax=Phytophthora megakarya TaxID=4795 RepID=A0A225W3C2_9STRA|nr:hypothetical protein PHMEG_00015244 [Phytophthora megakarya]
MYRPPRGPKATKFAHRWIGPMRIVSDTRYENYLVRREDKNGELREFIAHISFLTTYHEPTDAIDVEVQLDYESQIERESDDAETGTIAGTTTAPTCAVTGATGKRRRQRAITSAEAWEDDSELLVEIRPMKTTKQSRTLRTRLWKSYGTPEDVYTGNEGPIKSTKYSRFTIIA